MRSPSPVELYAPTYCAYEAIFLAFADVRSNRSSRALAWANQDVLDFYDFAHDKGVGEHKGVSEFSKLWK
ncbi:hypothetical protein CY34DRAFT_371728 [Suillus luteus UH-Slu-Lm8-n1]|uniref:Uncharacterized protein n=1 Tax=Suillus luteus UH-Slu-Lm8-n1 TaxID=930992 RepID=A0A0D0AWM0_9AGAM|nr:hypothetical protein CY34DRAFT_371728 [Suillus luteus UH-Slu-Lm8-n1]